MARALTFAGLTLSGLLDSLSSLSNVTLSHLFDNSFSLGLGDLGIGVIELYDLCVAIVPSNITMKDQAAVIFFLLGLGLGLRLRFRFRYWLRLWPFLLNPNVLIQVKQLR